MGSLKLGVQFGYWQAAPPPRFVETAQEAERLGYDSVWTAEAWGSDAFTALAWLGAHTQRVKLGTSIVQISARTPASTAMHVLTLDHLSGGRVILGLGVSGPQVVEGERVHRAGRGRAGRDLHDAGAQPDGAGVRADPRRGCECVRPPSLGGPDRVVAEALGFLRERHVEGIGLRAPVAELETEHHGGGSIRPGTHTRSRARIPPWNANFTELSGATIGSRHRGGRHCRRHPTALPMCC